MMGAGLVVIQKRRNYAALHQMLGNDFVNVFFLNTGIERALGVYDNDGAHFAQTKAAGAYNLYFLLQTLFLDGLFKVLHQLMRSGRSTARAAANQYMGTNQIHICKPP